MWGVAFGTFRYVLCIGMWNILMRSDGLAAGRFITFGFFAELVVGTMTSEAFFFSNLIRLGFLRRRDACHS